MSAEQIAAGAQLAVRPLDRVLVQLLELGLEVVPARQ